MMAFEPQTPDYEARGRESFGRQAMMATLGMEIDEIAPGEVTLSMPFDARFTQQHGFLHGGATAAGLDTACGFAAYTLMPAESGVLTVEFKINLLAPASGERFRFVARVVKPGRNLIFTEGQGFAAKDDTTRMIATVTATMMVVSGRDEIKG